MANIRIKDLSTTASTTASDDFFGVDGATNGTRKLNAYSPTFGGAIAATGTSTLTAGYWKTKPTADDGTLTGFALSNSGATTIGVFDVNTLTGDIRVGGTNSSYPLALYSKSVAVMTFGASSAATLAGNLTVSGGTVTSGTGTLTLNSSANTVVLQSAGTTALTLDSSQNATFAGNVRSNGVGFGVGVAADANTPFYAVTTSVNGSFTAQVKNTNAGSSAGASFIAESDSGTAIFRNHSIANSIWPGKTLISAPSGGTGLVLLTNAAGDPIELWTNGTKALTIDTSQNAEFAGNIKTAAPSGGTAGAWKLGVRVAATTTLDTTQYLQVDIGGTLYKVALVTS